jgi:putative ABC transport system permease protein
MISLAFKMLIGNRTSCIGVIFGIFLATLLISQQSAIFLGLVSRSYRLITDIPAPNVWVIDPATESEDKLRSLPLSYLGVVRSTPGIEWAVPLSSTLIPVITPAGDFDICQLYGIDDATLIGAPTHMLQGSIRDLRRKGAVIVDVYSANRALAKVMPDGSKVPLKVGDPLEINGRAAVVVGICEITQGFYPQPIIFTSLIQFESFNPGMANRVGFILAKTREGLSVDKVLKAINIQPGLQALTREQFENKIISFFLKTGILINFGLSVALGIIIGFSISGQIFYIMTLENLMYYALIKAVGGTPRVLLQMVLFQAALVGVIGFSLGIGATVLWGLMIKNTTLAFLFPWQLLLFTGAVVVVICAFTAALSIQKVLHIDPKALLGT